MILFLSSSFRDSGYGKGMCTLVHPTVVGSAEKQQKEGEKTKSFFLSQPIYLQLHPSTHLSLSLVSFFIRMTVSHMKRSSCINVSLTFIYRALDSVSFSLNLFLLF